MMSAMHQIRLPYGAEDAAGLRLRLLVFAVESSGSGIVLMQFGAFEASTKHSAPHLLFQSYHPIKVYLKNAHDDD